MLLKLKSVAAALAVSGALIVPAQSSAAQDYFTDVQVEQTPQGERVHVYHVGGQNYTANLSSSDYLHNRMWEEYKRKTPSHLHGQNMHDQLSCHIANAGWKEPWNLESWRPDVGYNQTVLHACNP